MEAKRKKISYVSEIGIQKRLCTSVPSSPATSDLFEYDLREEDDEDVEERITTKTGASFTVSPATSDLFEIVSQHGELSPNTSDLFEEPHHSDCIDEMKSSSYMITSYSGCERHLASEDDDIGCALLEDSDEEQGLSSTGKLNFFINNFFSKNVKGVPVRLLELHTLLQMWQRQFSEQL